MSRPPLLRSCRQCVAFAFSLALLLGATTACDVWDGIAIFTKNTPPPVVPDGVTAVRDLPFVVRPKRTLLLDLYIPDAAPAPMPVVLYVHGGGYFMGNRHTVGAEPVIWNLLDHGFAVATTDYRFSDEAIFPAQILDVTAALCWLRGNAVTYGLDRDRVVLAGQSSGAHLASLAGVGHADPAIHDDSCQPFRTDVSAVVDIYGPTDFSDLSPEDSPLFHKIVLLFDGDLEGNADLVAQASVLDRVAPDSPPFFIVHGDADDIVPIAQSIRLKDALGDERATFVTAEGGAHGGPEFETDALKAQVLDFVSANVADVENAP